ncbi:MAG: beta-ribofuranosylaminobenzene 5-phosphate synthase family [Ilumatobacteraceae bacterium]|nr:beta-ribofuranosylaminobenzene 5-phosphate synthase family [Ilumatobacteraceae bacterium]
MTVSCPDLVEGHVRDVSRALERLHAVRRDVAPVLVTIEAAPSPHIGLGSKTSIVLATLTAVNLELDLDLGERELQVISGRGGTSGIGIHTFFRGGLIIDSGHRAVEPRHYQPSSAASGGQIPPVLASLPMPVDWKVALLLIDGVRWSAAAEQRFFLENSPIDDREVDRAVAIVCMDVAASVVERDLPGFASAIRSLQLVGFKRREIEAQPLAVRTLLGALQATPTIAAGMSSIGPLIYAVYGAVDPVAKSIIDQEAARVGATLVATTQFTNGGYRVHDT